MVSVKAGRAEPDEGRERGHRSDQVDELAVQHAVRFTPVKVCYAFLRLV